MEVESVNCWKSRTVILEVAGSLSILQCEMEFTLRIAYHFVLERTFRVVSSADVDIRQASNDHFCRS